MTEKTKLNIGNECIIIGPNAGSNITGEENRIFALKIEGYKEFQMKMNDEEYAVLHSVFRRMANEKIAEKIKIIK